MPGEAKYTYAATVTLEANGGLLTNTSFAQANDAILSSANAYDYPLADFVLTGQFAAGITTAGAVINLFRQDQDIDGTADAPVPSANIRSLFVGSFNVPNGLSSATSVSMPCPGVPLGKSSYFYIENQSGQSLSAGWVLKATPKTLVPGT